MSPRMFATLAVGGAGLPLLVIALFWLSDMAVWPFASSEDRAPHHASRTSGGSRDIYLAELTQIYLTRQEAVVTDAMRDGSELAPTGFLNRELELRGIKWRVRTTAGAKADTYDVS